MKKSSLFTSGLVSLVLTHSFFSDPLLAGTHGPQLLPDQVGKCEFLYRGNGDVEMLLDERENLAYGEKTSDLSQGKFQIALKLAPAENLRRDFEDLYHVAMLNSPNDSNSKGMLLTNRSSYLDEPKSSEFYELSGQGSSDMISAGLHRTEVTGSCGVGCSELKKTIHSSMVFIPDIILKMSQQISIFDGKKWNGGYQGKAWTDEDTARLYALEKEHISQYGKPYRVIVYDLMPKKDQVLNGGKTISYFYPKAIGGKTLITSYNVMSINIQDKIAKWIVNSFKSIIFNNTKRGTGQFIDASREFYNSKS